MRMLRAECLGETVYFNPLAVVEIRENLGMGPVGCRVRVLGSSELLDCDASAESVRADFEVHSDGWFNLLQKLGAREGK